VSEAAGDPVRTRSLGAELLAEFLGTFILIIFGVGVVAQVVLTKVGEIQSIHWAWGLGVVLGVYVAGGVSGAHLNPAVTVALALRRGFPWAKVAPYSAAQVAGAFVAALVVRWNYSEAFARVDPGHTVATQGVFSTLPNGVTPLGGFRDQVIGTAVLVLLVLAVTDARNMAPAANLAPFIIGLIVVGIGMAIGANAGYAINPARDFGPRLASWLTGFSTAWQDASGNFYAWVPILGPLIGGPLGAYIYDWFVGRNAALTEPEVGRVPEQPESPERAESKERTGST
jgi:glycerol uptake facilitator protein